MRQGGIHALMRRKRKVKVVRRDMKSSTARKLDQLRRIVPLFNATAAAGHEMDILFQTVADYIFLLELKVCLLKAAVSCFHGGP